MGYQWRIELAIVVLERLADSNEIRNCNFRESISTANE